MKIPEQSSFGGVLYLCLAIFPSARWTQRLHSNSTGFGFQCSSPRLPSTPQQSTRFGIPDTAESRRDRLVDFRTRLSSPPTPTNHQQHIQQHHTPFCTALPLVHPLPLAPLSPVSRFIERRRARLAVGSVANAPPRLRPYIPLFSLYSLHSTLP
jgi:hypothetical protein